MKGFLLAVLALALPVSSIAQRFNQRLLLHHLCPDVTLSKGFHLPAAKRSIRDFQGLPLILYFYTTRCLACLATFPKIDSLQKEYTGRVNILLVGRESESRVASTFADRKPLQHLTLPVVVEDTALHRIFRHITVPHVVLIDRHGRVEAITGEVNKQTLTALISHSSLKVAEKRDAVEKDPEDPLLYTDWSYEKSWEGIYSATYIARSNPATAVVYGPRRDSNNHLYRWLDIGTIRELYSRVDPQLRGLNASRVLIDSSTELFKDETIYSFDVILKSGSSDQAFYAYAQEALDQYFGVESRVRTKPVHCWVIKQEGDKGRIPPTEASGWQLNYIADSLQFTATTWKGFFTMINGIKLTPPVEMVDETGLAGNQLFDLTVTTHIEDFASFQNSLAAYGLKLTEEKREMACIVLEKKEPGGSLLKVDYR